MQSPLPQQQQAAPAIVSTFPAPPPFYQLFTDSASAVPPPKPIVGQFQMFGKSWTVRLLKFYQIFFPIMFIILIYFNSD